MKEKIENELFYMLHEKKLDKITVTELVKRCNVSRQTFYYYFKDVYAVLDSIFKKETDNLMGDAWNVKSWIEGYVSLLHWSLEHETYIQNVMSSVPRANIEHCVAKKLYTYAIAEVYRCSDELNVSDRQKEYIAEFYALSLTACFIKWIENGMVSSPELEGQKMGILLDGNLATVLKNFDAVNMKNI